MKILVNATSLVTLPTGIGRYTLSMYREMMKRFPEEGYTFFYDYYYSKELKIQASPLVSKLRGKMVHRRGVIARGARKAKATWTKFSSLFRHFDVYHEPNFVPMDFPASKIVTTIHDLSFMLYPQWHPRERVEFMEKNFASRLKLSDVILTVSEYGKREVEKYVGIPGGKIRVVYNAVDERFRPLSKASVTTYLRAKRYPEDYVLFVGAVEPRKNLETLIGAFGDIERSFGNLHLIIVGPKGWLCESVFRKVEELGLTNKVHFTGFVADEELIYLYNGAQVFVYPSFYEGFGIPVLEAMACKIPVIVSNTSSLPELVGDAGMLVDPHSQEGFAEAMRKVLEDRDEAERLSEKGYLRSANFSWEKSAKALMDIFKGLL
ncbi:MAG: glycosyltransferase family 4 protein [Synergistetes bacterium]|nr:glycosyltransferase family 4 protein [Synergistota bacterium]